MSVDPERNAIENQQSPSDKLDAYIATLEHRTDFGVEDLTRRLIVKRNPNAEHSEPWPDSGWSVVTMGIDKDGVPVGIVEKYLHHDDDAPARKRIVLAEAFAYDDEQRAKIKATRIDMADSVFTVVGPDRPLAIKPFNDEFSHAMTRDEFNKQVGESSAQPELIKMPDWMKTGVKPVESVSVREQGSGNPEVLAQDRLSELTKGLSEDDIAHLEFYAQALDTKQYAQKSGDGEGSTRWGQIAGQHMRELSDAARAIASQYSQVYARLNKQLVMIKLKQPP